MKIGVFETEHFETVYPVIRLLEDHDITLFVTQEVADQLYQLLGKDSGKLHWIIRKENESNRDFIKSIGQYCNKASIEKLLLNTVSGSFLFFARMTKRLQITEVYLVIHDVNNMVQSKPSLSVRRTIRHWGKRRLLKQCKQLFTISNNTTAYLKSLVSPAKRVDWLPGAIFEKAAYHSPVFSNPVRLKIVVPGSLDKRRRDYEQVFQLSEMIVQEQLPIEICLLGGFGSYRDEELLNRCRHYKERYQGFRFFDVKEVPQHIFTTEMNGSHFIWIPSVIHTSIADGIPETYGVSKSSGNLFDAVRYARPFLIPHPLKIDPLQEKAAIRYETVSSMLAFLSDIIRDPHIYENWRARALEMSEQYEPRLLKKEVSKLFNP